MLLGFDCKKAADGKAHWFGQHGPELCQKQPFDYWLQLMPLLARDLRQEGTTVINASRDTALQCFERMPLEQAIDAFRPTE